MKKLILGCLLAAGCTQPQAPVNLQTPDAQTLSEIALAEIAMPVAINRAKQYGTKVNEGYHLDMGWISFTAGENKSIMQTTITKDEGQLQIDISTEYLDKDNDGSLDEVRIKSIGRFGDTIAYTDKPVTKKGLTYMWQGAYTDFLTKLTQNSMGEAREIFNRIQIEEDLKTRFKPYKKVNL